MRERSGQCRRHDVAWRVVRPSAELLRSRVADGETWIPLVSACANVRRALREDATVAERIAQALGAITAEVLLLGAAASLAVLLVLSAAPLASLRLR